MSYPPVALSGPSNDQLVEQRLSLFQIERIEAFGEPPVDRREKLASRVLLCPGRAKVRLLA
jgi:hypothetical protein